MSYLHNSRHLKAFQSTYANLSFARMEEDPLKLWPPSVQNGPQTCPPGTLKTQDISQF